MTINSKDFSFWRVLNGKYGIWCRKWEDSTSKIAWAKYWLLNVTTGIEVIFIGGMRKAVSGLLYQACLTISVLTKPSLRFRENVSLQRTTRARKLKMP